MKRKKFSFSKLLTTVLVLTALMGTVAFAASFSFSLPAGTSGLSDEVRKTTNTNTAYVSISSADATLYSTVQVVNPSGVARSSTGRILGVGQTYLSYSGYTVNNGDVLRLKVTNEVSYNLGRSLYISGSWEP